MEKQQPQQPIVHNKPQIPKQVDQDNQTSKEKLKKELIEMEFDEVLVKQAIQKYSNKDEAIQFIIQALQSNQNLQIHKQHQNDFQDCQDQYKMVFLVRMDLKMGLGKMAAQVGHAALKAYKQIERQADKEQYAQVAFYQWLENGQKKIVLKVDSQQQLLQLYQKACNRKINACYIRDAGLTQIAAGSVTVAAIGPASSSEIDGITKHLKLM